MNKNIQNKRSINGLFLFILIMSMVLPSSILFFNYNSGDQIAYSNREHLIQTSDATDFISVSANMFYPASTGFDTDSDYTYPEDWIIELEESGIIRVVPECDGHAKVLSLFDGSTYNGQAVHTYYGLPHQEEGTIEFWARVASGGTGKFVFSVLDDTLTGISLIFEENVIQYYDGAYYSISSYEEDQWYHVRIEFDCESDWHLWIDGQSIDQGAGYSYRSPSDLTSMTRFFANTISRTRGTLYVDAVGFSWDSSYEIGDNTQKYIKNPTVGYYPASTGFDTDSDNTYPEDWIIEIEEKGSIRVVSECEGHKKVLRLKDDGSYLPGQAVHTYYELPHQEEGTIEFWARVASGGTGKFVFSVLDDTLTGISLIFEENVIQYYDGAYYSISSYEEDQWYHVRIEFDCESDWHLWIDGQSIDQGAGYSYRSPSDLTSMTRFFANTITKTVGTFYVDAVGFSWDSSYEIGDNREMGLKLDIKSSSNIDMSLLEYSIDGEGNIPLPSNSIIPMLENGDHTMQLFGTNTNGIEIESELVEFTVDLSIQITSHQDGDIALLDINGMFNFEYEYAIGYIDEVKLLILGNTYTTGVLGHASSDLSNVADILVQYDSILVKLQAFKDGAFISEDSVNLKFDKIEYECEAVIDSGIHYEDPQLLLILHDPLGDQSFSSFTETSSYTIGFGYSEAYSMGIGIEVAASFDLFVIPIEIDFKLDMEWTSEVDNEWELTTSRATSFISSLYSNNPEYIGPGGGDIYYGETWAYNWELRGTYQLLSSGIERYADPVLCYGVNRMAEFAITDNDPRVDEFGWKSQNPNYNPDLEDNIEWWKDIDTKGAKSTDSFSIESTTKREKTFTFDVNTELSITIGDKEMWGAEASFSISFGYEFQTRTTTSSEYKTELYYEIFDDEPEDELFQRVGIDKIFGTFIFQNRGGSRTTGPHEYNTIDYIPPSIGMPTINLDSNDDGLFPTIEDSPEISVEIEDDVSIGAAFVVYSVNGGDWNRISLIEQPLNLGHWDGYIPSASKGSEILWYIEAIDTNAQHSERLDGYGNYFTYIVINSAPEVELITPVDNGEYGNTVEISWFVFDADMDDLTINLYYFEDGSTIWKPIALNIVGNSYLWDVSSISSEYIQVKIKVSDNESLSEDYTIDPILINV